MLRAWRERGREEAGFTILEVTMVSAILLLVMGTFFGLLLSLTKTEQRTDALVGNEQDARFVLTALARDLRAANPLNTFATATEYQSKVQMTLGAVPNQQVVRWVYDTAPASPTYRSLLRQTVAANGTVSGSTVRLRNIRNAERSPPVPLFRFTSQSGVDLVAAGQAANVGNCAIQVHVTITADSNPGPEPFTVVSDVQLRNRLPGGVGCG
ncbi:MAG: hypothetical protein AVDCRST_MAG20-2307 [uncultured Acidimicrobiales bacterium]|uniref:Prepilin-type N-terminal cleavage/methylation domain-containing protein n=1 Tax=uncultured Acidimicrobiales bacterium TaxID=310071 RepID=A0A6J4IKW7_9ACTN|nr:MAG: hypothetical protein AVDCRST_MAG20-2307 [uncultured Acidimicrobiales bacterium]